MAKERSPNYPAIGLTTAVNAIQKLWEKEKRSPIPIAGIAQALGHENLSGPATSKVAALRQYGLIESFSPGKYRISESALPLILRKPTDPEYLPALRKAALAPPLFAELFAGYPDASPDNLRYHLIKDRKFSTEGAAKVVRALQDAVTIAKLGDESYASVDEDPSIEWNIPDKPEPPPKPGDPNNVERKRMPLLNTPGVVGVAYSLPLPDGVEVQLTFAPKPTAKSVDRLIAHLKLMREDLPEAEPTMQTSPTNEE